MYLSEKEMDKVLDDLVAYGIYDKFRDGKKQEVKLTKARRKRVEDAIMLGMVASTGYHFIKAFKDLS